MPLVLLPQVIPSIGQAFDNSANDGIIGSGGNQMAGIQTQLHLLAADACRYCLRTNFPGWTGIGVCLVVAVASGLCTGVILKLIKDDVDVADDSPYWEVAESGEKED